MRAGAVPMAEHSWPPPSLCVRRGSSPVRKGQQQARTSREGLVCVTGHRLQRRSSPLSARAAMRRILRPSIQLLPAQGTVALSEPTWRCATKEGGTVDDDGQGTSLPWQPSPVEHDVRSPSEGGRQPREPPPRPRLPRAGTDPGKTAPSALGWAQGNARGRGKLGVVFWSRVVQ